MQTVRPLPGDSSIPNRSDIADGLAAALPESDRAAGRALLIDELLPVALHDVPNAENPRALLEVHYEAIAERLRAVHPSKRLGELKKEVLRAQLLEQQVMSLALAIARFLADHPDDLPNGLIVKRWVSVNVARFRKLTKDDFTARAEHRRNLLATWKRDVAARYPTMWQSYRIDYQTVESNLVSASTGRFFEASGGLADFLEDMGVELEDSYEF